MASKGQKFKKYSDELRKEIVKKYIDGDASSRGLSKEYNIPFKTIDNYEDFLKERRKLMAQKLKQYFESL